MKRLEGKTVFISGASGGIGRSCAEYFSQAGAKVVLGSRNLVKLQDLAKEISEKTGIPVYAVKLDVTDRNGVKSILESLPEEFASIDILVNNAGLALGLDKVHDGNMDDWDTMIDTNIKGLLYLTRTIVPGMIDRGYGHVINIGSTAAIHAYPNGAVYCATKAAVKFISDGLRMDVVDKPVRVTNIQPGMTETDFSTTRFKGDEVRASKVYEGLKPLSPDDIADIVLYAASVPEHVQIHEVTVTPTSQATGRVIYREG